MLSRGSEWRRWEPHIHAPGTVMNNQYQDPLPGTIIFPLLKLRRPLFEAIAVTDYYVTRYLSGAFEAQGRRSAAGREAGLPECGVEA